MGLLISVLKLPFQLIGGLLKTATAVLKLPFRAVHGLPSLIVFILKLPFKAIRGLLSPFIGSSPPLGPGGSILPPNSTYSNQRELDNHANQCNPNNSRYQGHTPGYGGSGTRADLNNHANQMNPNNGAYSSREWA